MQDDAQNQTKFLLEKLNKQEQAIIQMRFGILEDKTARTQEEVAQFFNISKQIVDRIEKAAIRKLKIKTTKKEI